MPEFHAEPYVYLAGLSHNSALVAWGAFYFRVRTDGRMKLVDDPDLEHVHPPRRDTIGARSAPYGPAHVEVFDEAGALVASARTQIANHCWLSGLSPDTTYHYRVTVKGEEWAQGERWDWSPAAQALLQAGGRYEHRFRTFPHPAQPSPAVAFAVIGDFGVGMRKASRNHRQQQVADTLRQAVRERGVRFVLTTGDNIYAGTKFLGIPVGETGDEDDDWFFTFFQPYRYVINQVPVFPSIGNHDADETEEHDDRSQVEDNFYLEERIAGQESAGRASFKPGLFYRFLFGADIELVCIDTSKEHFFGQRLFAYPKHQPFLDRAFPPAGTDAVRWRVPFCHHPPFCAGPRHHNTTSMQALLPLLARSGVRVMFSGHEHNFQHSQVDGRDYFVSGAAGKVRTGVPDDFAGAGTVSWSNECHFLLVEIEGDRMQVRAIGESNGGPELREITRRTPSGDVVMSAIDIRLQPRE